MVKNMKVLNSFLLVFAFALTLVLTPESLAQQRRQPAKPVRKVATVQNVPTFDTLIAADTYKIYVEVRGVGQLVRSNSVNELIDPVMKLADPPREFKTLVKWLNTHADDVMTSRMLVATWATAKNVPEALVAIEFASPEEAMKFEPRLNSFLPKVLPTPAPQASPSQADTTTSSKPGEEVAPKPQYFLKQVGSLILITPSALNLKDLRPPKSRALTEEPSFRVARNRFASEQFFVYVDVNGIEKEEEDRGKQYQVEEAKRSEEEAKRAADNPVAPDSSTTEEKKPNEDEQQAESPSRQLQLRIKRRLNKPGQTR